MRRSIPAACASAPRRSTARSSSCRRSSRASSSARIGRPARSATCAWCCSCACRTALALDEALIDRIKQHIRANTTPRHVPAKVVQVTDIPRTKSNKIVELAGAQRRARTAGQEPRGAGQSRGARAVPRPGGAEDVSAPMNFIAILAALGLEQWRAFRWRAALEQLFVRYARAARAQVERRQRAAGLGRARSQRWRRRCWSPPASTLRSMPCIRCLASSGTWPCSIC